MTCGMPFVIPFLISKKIIKRVNWHHKNPNCGKHSTPKTLFQQFSIWNVENSYWISKCLDNKISSSLKSWTKKKSTQTSRKKKKRYVFLPCRKQLPNILHDLEFPFFFLPIYTSLIRYGTSRLSDSSQIRLQCILKTEIQYTSLNEPWN